MIELRKYLGILLMIGIDSKPEIKRHLQKNGMWTSGQIQKISRVKFKSIGCFLDLGKKNPNDPFARIIIIFDTM